MNIDNIFDRVKAHSENSPGEWNLNSFESFIISFEKNSQAANEDLARHYGNIIKDLVGKIQLRDAILLQEDGREKEVLQEILADNTLKELFSKLYVLINRSNRQKTRNNF